MRNALPNNPEEVTEADKPVRLDNLLSTSQPQYSRSTWQKYIKQGYVTVGGEVILSPKKEFLPDVEIELTIPDDKPADQFEIPVVYQDDNVIVINKPQGILTHSKGDLNEEQTVADHFASQTSYKSDTNRPGIVHRLDRDTGGLLIYARNDETANLLGRQFSDRKVKKSYLAVVEGTPKQASAQIDLPLGRNPKQPSRFRVSAEGKPSITNYEVLASNGRRSLVLLMPKTGRTHQLRVHMQYIGTPIVGDTFYGTKKTSTGLMLHAWKLEITIPEGDRRTFMADIPDRFTSMFPEACDELA